jgi:hypothetical protein
MAHKLASREIGVQSDQWLPEQVDELSERSRRGESAAQIAYALGRSRSAVLGKLKRLGLQYKAPPISLASVKQTH